MRASILGGRRSGGPAGTRRRPGHPAGAAERRGSPRRRAAVWGTAGAGVACVALGIVLAVVPGGPADVGALPPAAPAVASPNGLVPAAEDVPAPPTGTVPVAFALPDRGVSAPVVPTGTDADGALVIPDPPSTVGWWSPGALAGAPSGTTVLAGHVDSAVAGLGTFAVLRAVGVGERVELRGADGRTFAYRIVARRQLEKADLPADLFARAGPPRLALVTCGGRFDYTTRHYTDNVIVYAEPA